jgi:UDP-N-acetylglucosamine diphosphorylase/glucosamine-1-phosphate N-acetyltransferase
VDTRAAFDLCLGGRTLLEAARAAFEPDALVLHARSLVAGVTALAHPDARVRTLPNDDVLFWNARAVAYPSPVRDALAERTQQAETAGVVFHQEDTVVAAYVPDARNALPGGILDQDVLDANAFDMLPSEPATEVRLVSRLWHLLDNLRDRIAHDIAALAPAAPTAPLEDRPDVSIHPSAVLVGPSQIVAQSGATVRPGAILNADEGPIFLGQDATIHERAVVRGPCFVGPRARIKIGADVEGTVVGHHSKVGGEVHSSVIHSLSNKGHAGFLGDSYLGRWCNLGAGTNISNLRNDYGPVSLYDVAAGAFANTARQFMGLVMGDHSKCGINTMFNTGTVVGAVCNIYDSGFPPRYVPAFSWGRPGAGFTDYRLEKALRVAETVMARRDRSLTNAHRRLLTSLFERTAGERAAQHG